MMGLQAKELWFTENYSDGARFSIRIDAQVYAHKSRFQQIDLYDTPEFGRVLVLDGCVMLTEKDEFIYHEMIVHPSNGGPSRISRRCIGHRRRRRRLRPGAAAI